LFSIIQSYIEKTAPRLESNRFRQAIAFHVDQTHSHKELEVFISKLPQNRKLIISASINQGVSADKSKTCLGEEYDLVVFDARETFDADAMGVVSGVLCGGGFLLLVLPDKQQWSQQKSLYLSHVKKMLENNAAVIYFADNEIVEINEHKYSDSVLNSGIDCAQDECDTIYPYRTFDQQQAVEQISENLKGKKTSCVVLRSGRGRGKSTSLGLLSAKLLINERASGDEESGVKILITAPRRSVADPFFRHLQLQCPQGTLEKSSFLYKKSQVQFVAPDALIDTFPVADVLFIDEAAAIPLSMLESLLDYYPRIIFSTTTHGYEGTGRGFLLKFYKLLNQKRPEWQEIKLNQPVRWSQDDPLEKWIEELLFLDVEFADKPILPEQVIECEVKLIKQRELIQNKSRLNSVFSLLVFAHYRTSPSDFKYIMDSNFIRIYCLEYKGNVLAVLLVNQEGGFEKDLSSAIYRGERRPRGNLLAQTLCFHAGYEQAACFDYARIMRIAVHPQVQFNGLGSYLLEEVIKKEKSKGMDVIGSSFSATKELLGFWSKADMALLRIGFSRDHVSASNSAVVAKSLSYKSKEMIDVLRHKFSRNLSLWLNGPLSNVSLEMQQYLLKYYAENFEERREQADDEKNQLDVQDIESFALYNRNYESCMPAIVRWLESRKTLVDQLGNSDREIINASLRYNNNWKLIVEEIKCSGKTQAVSKLRIALKHLLLAQDVE